MSKFARIKDIAVLNQETFKKDSLPLIIKYLDTGSLTKNKIESFQLFSTKSDKIPSRAQRKVFANTILYSNVRPNQEHFGIIERDFKDIVVSTGFSTIDITDENVYPKFIYYLLTQKKITDYLHTIGMNAVSSYPSISPDDIGNLKFKLPDLPAQKSIAKVLSVLDAKIELNNRINQELEALAKTLYDYWFVQFDFPNEQGKPYKSSGGKMIYSKELKREIPEGWNTGCFNDLGEIIGGSTPARNNPDFFTANGIPWITPNDLSNNKGNKFISKGEFDITKEGLQNASLRTLPKNSILLSSRAPIGYMAINRNDVTTNQGFKSFIPNKGYPFSFVYYLIKNSIKLIEKNASGSTFKEISGGVLKSLPTLLPHKIIIENYATIIKSTFERQNLIELENQKLAELRDWLLPMLMNGQVIVGEVEEELNIAAEPKEKYDIK